MTANGEKAFFPPNSKQPLPFPSTFSSFRCNWHDSYTSSSLSSQQAVKNEPSRRASEWLIWKTFRGYFALSCDVYMCREPSFLGNFMMIIFYLSGRSRVWVWAGVISRSFWISSIIIEKFCVKTSHRSAFYFGITGCTSLIISTWILFTSPALRPPPPPPSLI